MKRSREAALARQYHAGDSAAGWTVVDGISGWIEQQARWYQANHDYPFDDLRSEGRIAAFALLTSFDPTRGRFLGWVKREVRKRMSVYGHEVANSVGTRTTAGRIDTWKRTARNLNRELGRPASPDEIGDRLGSREATRTAMHRLMSNHYSVDEIMARESMENSPSQYGKALDLLHALSDGGKSEDETYRRCDESSVADAVRGALAEMSGRELVIVRTRLMAELEDRPTLMEVGKILGISRERVRQLEIRIRMRLRRRLGKRLGMDAADE